MNYMNPVKILALCFAALIPSLSFGNDYYGSNAALETVYTQSNDADHNEILAFRRNGTGAMEPVGRFATGGTGTGAGLGNQGALALNENERYLFAVNAGSNDVSVFRIRRQGLELLHVAAEDGLTPVSVTVSRNRVYVVNTGDDSIFGFRFDPRSGKLKPLPDSHRKLSGNGSAPAQISFNRSAGSLVVTEKTANKITVFSLNDAAVPEARFVLDSAGTTPFGFAFGKRDQFFVSEAQGGAQNGATVSSYQLLADGGARLIDGAVAVGQTAACWLAVTPNGRTAFTANTPAGSLSAFAIDAAGNMKLLQSIAAEETGPRDLAISPDGKRLYSLNGGDNSIAVYRIRKGGVLHKLQSFYDLPEAFTGLVVR